MRTPVYYARLYDTVGVLAVIDRALTFLNTATMETVVIAPPDVNFLTTLGRVHTPGLAQRFCERMRGQHAHLACRLGE